MEAYTNEQIAAIEAIIAKYLNQHREYTVDSLTLNNSKLYLNRARTSWITMNGNVLEFHITGGKWRVVPV